MLRQPPALLCSSPTHPRAPHATAASPLRCSSQRRTRSRPPTGSTARCWTGAPSGCAVRSALCPLAWATACFASARLVLYVGGHGPPPQATLSTGAVNRLFIGNIPRAVTNAQLRAQLGAEVVGAARTRALLAHARSSPRPVPPSWPQAHGPPNSNPFKISLEEVELVADRDRPEQNRGFGFLSFYNHAAADAARRKLNGSTRWASRRGVARRNALCEPALAPAGVVAGRAERAVGSSQHSRKARATRSQCAPCPPPPAWGACALSTCRGQRQRRRRRPRDGGGVKSVHVSGLPLGVSQDELRDVFAPFGQVRVRGRMLPSPCVPPAPCPLALCAGTHGIARPTRETHAIARPTRQTRPTRERGALRQIEELKLLPSRDDPSRMRDSASSTTREPCVVLW